MNEAGAAGPLVVGATGGSGTRVLARILRAAGLYIGARLNVSEDALEFGAYSDRWINAYLGTRAERMGPVVQSAMSRDLAACLRRHLAPLGGALRPWGWKEPRSIFLLPFLHSRLPGLKFLHVVRDGRDMAFSANQNQLQRHGRAMLTPRERARPQAAQSALLWARVNTCAADYGEGRMGRQYLRIRYEDLCAEPAAVTDRVLAFAGLTAEARALAARELAAPDTLGRWRRQSAADIAEVEAAARPALRRLGYLDD